ncbi:glycosyltransferase family 2 protein [Romboutsia sp. 1001713B170207_170306_H8]|uniref:glycosyltransferase family 2 protein n=1 Tax=Romboutsia sp. 1001713B170207_170306_H8 TaxID=2787112 RepID=UPI0008231018|nr:glycosyltransferase family 2 protein [Romboutsia sp. 1001713B170207_170306_H8]SCH19957.1 Hyaluronan synthase [uncultured Clostridium sp.]
MSKTKVSIIVPIYNAERDLKCCIDSILSQTFEDIEVILVNDGSTDKSREICDEYAIKDKRIILIHKKNQGVSSARNLGIKESTGDYIMFCDSDDWIESDCIEKLYSKIKDSNADIIYSGVYREEYTNGKKIQDKVSGVSEEIFIKKEDFDKYLDYIIESIKSPFLSPCAKLYNASIIRNNNLKFDIDMVCFEDFCFNLKFLQNTKSMYLSKDIKYHYRGERGKGGIQKRNKNDLVYEVSSSHYEMNKLLRLIKYNEELKDYIEIWFLEHYKIVFEKIIFEENNMSKIERNNILKHLCSDKEFCDFIEYNKDKIRLYKYIKILVDRRLYSLAYLLIKNRIK